MIFKYFLKNFSKFLNNNKHLKVKKSVKENTFTVEELKRKKGKITESLKVLKEVGKLYETLIF